MPHRELHHVYRCVDSTCMPGLDDLTGNADRHQQGARFVFRMAAVVVQSTPARTRRPHWYFGSRTSVAD